MVKVFGFRCVVSFTPKMVGPERLVAGVVTLSDDGVVGCTCALDAVSMQRMFGVAGSDLCSAALHLLQSLVGYLENGGTADGWDAPFSGALVSAPGRFSSHSAEQARHQLLMRVSSFYALVQGGAYAPCSPKAQRPAG